MIERWVELIARCAGARGAGGSRVLSARAHTLAKPYTYCYLERGESDMFVSLLTKWADGL